MKRQAKRSTVKLSPAKEAELRQVREKILREEKEELSADARRFRKQRQAAQAELARTAELLKSERESQGISLTELQNRTGINRAALCRLENLVDANPTVGTLDRIAT